MAGNMIKITDYDKVTPTKDDVLLINQNGSNRKTTVNDLVGDIGTLGGKKLVEKVNDNTTQLNALMNIKFKNIVSITKNISNKNIKIIGDSITEGIGGSNYNSNGETIFDTYKVNSGHCWANSLKSYLESKFSCVVKNWGISGATSTFIVDNLSKLVKSTDDIIICKIGINDRLDINGKLYLTNNLKTIYNYVIGLGKEIVFISPIMCVDETKYFTALDIDNIYMKVCSELCIEYISLYKLFLEYIENKNISLSSLLLADGLHPNDTGYDIMYYLILSKLGFAIIYNLIQAGLI